MLNRKATFEPIATAQNDLFVSYVGFGIEKPKMVTSSNINTCDDRLLVVGTGSDLKFGPFEIEEYSFTE